MAVITRNLHRGFRTGVFAPGERRGLIRGREAQVIKVLESKAKQALAVKRPIRAAVMTGGRGIAVRVAAAGARRVFGSRTPQVQAIIRQTTARPTVRVAAAGGAVVAAERAIEATTGRSPARMIFDMTRGSGQPLIPFKKPGIPFKPDFPGGFKGGHRKMPGQQLAVQHVAINQWQTFPGGPVFTRFADGHIEVQKKNGVIRHFRPYRPVVIPKRWNARSMSRVATALKRQRKTATKILQITGGVPKRTVRVGRAHKSVDV